MVLSPGPQWLLVRRRLCAQRRGTESSCSRFEEGPGDSREDWTLEKCHFGPEQVVLSPPHLSRSLSLLSEVVHPSCSSHLPVGALLLSFMGEHQLKF